MSKKPGDQIGHYRVEAFIGAGGMGSVWSGVDEVSGQKVALKFLKTPERARPEHRVRLVREARVAHAVRHPGLVQVLDVIDFNGSPVLVMELLEGETLRGRLSREAPLPLEEVAALLCPAVDALRAAHAAGIVHRDLKPENVFLLASGPGQARRVKILDFGIVKFFTEAGAEAGADQLTALGALLGTAPYMAPEQVLGASDVDPRADIWALGVILYEALAACRPIEGTNQRDIVRRLLTDGITPIQALVPGLPGEFGELLMSMLSRAPEQRPHDLSVVADALSRYLPR